MENQISLEQALKNIEIVIVQSFSGTRNEHMTLDQSLKVIKSELDKCKQCAMNLDMCKSVPTPEGGC